MTMITRLGKGSVTTPEQLLAGQFWRIRNSVYTLWALLWGCGFVSLFYTGVRAKKNTWTTWGAIYGVVTIGAMTVFSVVSPDDPEASTPVVGDIAIMVYLAVWIVSAIHVFRERKKWLRWKAQVKSQAKWYETSAAPVGLTSELAPLGIDDPTSEYLAATQPPPPHTSSNAPTLHRPAVSPPPPAPPRTQPPPPSVTGTPEGTGHPAGPTVDLNVASIDEIAALPGVGVASATRMVEQRTRRNGFESVDEAAIAAGVQPHVRARLPRSAVVSPRAQPQRRTTSGRIVDI